MVFWKSKSVACKQTPVETRPALPCPAKIIMEKAKKNTIYNDGCFKFGNHWQLTNARRTRAYFILRLPESIWRRWPNNTVNSNDRAIRKRLPPPPAKINMQWWEKNTVYNDSCFECTNDWVLRLPKSICRRREKNSVRSDGYLEFGNDWRYGSACRDRACLYPHLREWICRRREKNTLHSILFRIRKHWRYAGACRNKAYSSSSCHKINIVQVRKNRVHSVGLFRIRKPLLLRLPKSIWRMREINTIHSVGYLKFGNIGDKQAPVETRPVCPPPVKMNIIGNEKNTVQGEAIFWLRKNGDLIKSWFQKSQSQYRHQSFFGFPYKILAYPISHFTFHILHFTYSLRSPRLPGCHNILNIF